MYLYILRMEEPGRFHDATLVRLRQPDRTGGAALPVEKTPISLQPSYTAAPLEKDGLIAAYEELRRQNLNGQRGPGLALFMRRGMREWMMACSLCLAPSPTREFTAAPDETVLPQSARTEVVLILAGMLLHGCQERVS